MTFGNAKQSIPERFIAKMEIDKKIKETHESHAIRDGNVYHVADLQQYGKDMKPLREEQLAYRISCDNLIKDQKARGGPTA